MLRYVTHSSSINGVDPSTRTIGVIAKFPNINAAIPNRTPMKTIIEKFLLASSDLFSPNFFAITALPPDANIIPTAISTFKTGNTILMADKASLPTNLDTKIPSMIVYNDINTIITIDGKANFSNEYNLKS